MSCIKISFICRIFIVLLLFLLSRGVTAQEGNVHRVRDLDYGVSLYHFYQNKYLSAITDILIAEHYQRIDPEHKNPQLLLGGLYLSYDLHNKSSEIFENLLHDKSLAIAADIKDRAWFLLGKNHYRNGFIKKAEQSLIKVKGSLQLDDEEQRLYLLNTIYLREKDIVAAENILTKFPENSTWKYYSQFNTASYLIQTADKVQQGHKLFSSLSSITPQTSEQSLLVDKANLALAYVALKDKKSQVSIERFNKIRLESAETNKALLGIGWARYREKQYKEAIIPWMNLASSYAESDLSVQEALISIPYAFEKMQENEQALYQYGLAIESYKFQLSEIQQLEKLIKSVKYIKQLNPGSLGDESIPVKQIVDRLDPLILRYLLSLITSQEYQSSVQSYQQLIHMRYLLKRWQNSMPALHMILAEKRKTYKNKLSRTLNDKSLDRVLVLVKRRDKLVEFVKSIELEEKAFKLASASELEQMALLKVTSDKINKLKSSSEDLSEQRFKQRILNGVLAWEIETDYPVRVWHVKKSLRELNLAVKKMNTSIASLKASYISAPQQFLQFDDRINNKNNKIKQLAYKINEALKEQQYSIRAMTLDALKIHRNQIKLYHDRALYAKARLYDSLMGHE